MQAHRSTRYRFNHPCAVGKRFFTAACLALAWHGFAPAADDDALTIDKVQLTLIAQAEVAAREAGMLAEVSAVEGQLVAEDDLMARIEDNDAILARNRARIELDIAAAEATNDLAVRFAKKATEVAEAELRRSLESRDRYKKSVSDTEIDRLRLAAEQHALEIEQAQHELMVAGLTRTLKENELRIAERDVERRGIKAPIAGVVAQVFRRAGEWVEPGEPVIRVLRVDRLRAEAFVNVRQVTSDLEGRRVTLTVDLSNDPKAEFTGKIVFVSPEVNPVNGEVRVWAEIDNRDRLLRPGLHGSLRIEPAASATESAP